MHRVSADTSALYVFHHQHLVRTSIPYPRDFEAWITAEPLQAPERPQAGHLPGVVTFVRRFFLHGLSHSHQSAPFAGDDGEVEYNKHLIEKKAAREKPPRRQQYTDIAQVARYVPRDVWGLDLRRDTRGQSRR